MYYGLILISVVIFSSCFAFNDVYRKVKGSSLKASLQFSLLSAIPGFLILLAINGFKIDFTPFTLIMAMIATLNSFAFTFCSFKALNSINLSLYSLFSMLGGMLLPFLQGIIFYGEALTVAKTVCIVLIILALLFTIEKDNSKRKGGFIYYIGIFICNGMSGVLSKIFTSAPFEKATAADYSILSTICTIVISALLLLIFFRKQKLPRFTPLSLFACVGNGILNRLANFWLVIALAHVDASVQYPMVTGGVMIASTIICFFGENKPSAKETFSVVLAFIGMIVLFAVPI